jgi:nicotinamidase-related amidase
MNGAGRMAGLCGLPDEHVIVGRAGLLIIDAQHDFMDEGSANYNLGAENIIAPIAKLIALFRAKGLPLFFTKEVHRPGRVDAGLEAYADYHVVEHTVDGTRGCEIIGELTPLDGEFVIDKRRYSCFLGTELEPLLRAQSVETLVICGVSSDICVHWTSGEAFQRDFHVRVVEDCTAGMSAADHAASLLILRNLCSGGRSIFAIDVINSLQESSRRPSTSRDT